MDTKLKPCPFCGKSEADIIDFVFEPWSSLNPDKVVRCENCGSQGEPCSTEAQAVEAWNDRDIENKIQAATETWSGIRTASAYDLVTLERLVGAHEDALLDLKGLLEKETP